MQETGKYEQIRELAAVHGVLRPRDVESAGIAREYLLRMVETGQLWRSGRGLYRLANAPVTEHHSLADVAKRVPGATVCLLSALVFHGLTTQNPAEVWIALPRGARSPKSDSVAVRTMKFSGRALTAGREAHKVEGVEVQVYSIAKTIADCFKYRNKIGLDVALEALRECLRRRLAPVADIRRYAEVCRVARVMRPYMEAMK